MWVVNKNCLSVSKIGTSKVPIMVNKIIIDIVVIMGVIELLVKQLSISDREETTVKLKKAIKNAPINRQTVSAL